MQRISRTCSIAALLAVAVLLAAASWRCIWGVDFWWQYATGRFVAENGPPGVDVFSYTMAGEPWIELRWLYCVGLYRLYDAFGAAGPIVVKWLVLTVSFGGVVATIVDRRSRTTAAMVLLCAVLAASQRFFVRPELVTFGFFSVYIWILHRWRTRSSRLIWLLPVLQIIWTNAHTLFILGPLLVGLAWTVALLECVVPRIAVDVGNPATMRRTRTAAIVLVGSSAACFINPWGVAGVVFPFQLFTQIQGTSFNEYITEFKSPFDVETSYAALWWYKALIAVCALSLVANVRRLSPFWLILVLSQFSLSMLAIRNIPLFALAAVPFVIDNAARGWVAAVLRNTRAARVLEPLTAVAVVGVSAWYTWALSTSRYYVFAHDTNRFGFELAPNRYPLEAIRFMTSNDLEGPVLHTFDESAPLLAHGYSVQFDPRLEVYGETEFDQYWAMFENPSLVDSRRAEFNWQVALVNLQSRLINHFVTDPHWELVFFDSVAAVYLRAGVRPDVDRLDTDAEFAEVLTSIRDSLPAPTQDFADVGTFESVQSPVAYMVVSDALQVYRQPLLALELLEDAHKAWPGALGLQRRMAFAQQNAGQVERAIDEWAKLAEQDPTDAEPPYRIGVLHARAGRNAQAADALSRSLKLLDANPDGWALLARVRIDQGQTAEALANIKRAVELEPASLGFRKLQAQIMVMMRQFDEAERLLLELLEQSPADAALYRDLAYAAVNAGDPHRALQYLDRGLEQLPRNTMLMEIRASIHSRFNIEEPDDLNRPD